VFLLNKPFVVFLRVKTETAPRFTGVVRLSVAEWTGKGRDAPLKEHKKRRCELIFLLENRTCNEEHRSASVVGV
jgi:hypothetical protein